MSRINIEAELIECAVPIEAARGDRLVVLHGVVVGVDRVVPTIHVTPPSHPQSPPSHPQSPPSHPQSPSMLHNAIQPPYLAAAIPVAEGVLRMLRAMNRPMTAKEIGSRWPRSQGEQAPRLSDAFALLRQRKLIEKVVAADGKEERFPPYRLADASTEVQAQATMVDDLQPPWGEEPA